MWLKFSGVARISVSDSILARNNCGTILAATIIQHYLPAFLDPLLFVNMHVQQYTCIAVILPRELQLVWITSLHPLMAAPVCQGWRNSQPTGLGG